MAEVKPVAEKSGEGWNSPSMAAAWLLLGAAAALFFAGRAAPLEMAQLVFLSLSIGLCAVSVFAFWVRAIGGGTMTMEAGFKEIFEDADRPAVVTDQHGVVIALNRAAKDKFFGEQSGAFAAEVFSAWTHDAEEIVYRLARRAKTDGEASESLRSATPLRLSARRMKDARLLWSMEGESGASALHREDAPFGAARIDSLGALREANAVFKAYSDSERTAIVGAAKRAQAAGLAYAAVDLDGGRRVTLAIHPGDLGDLTLFATPEWTTEDRGCDLAFEQLPVALARLTPDGDVISVNAAARALLGPAARPGAAFTDLAEGLGRKMETRIEEAVEGEGLMRSELAVADLGDQEVFLQISFGPFNVDGGSSLLAVMSDATELKTLEQQFVQSQKMQAVGQLAGGVAHDFNNLLTAILGHTDLLMMRADQATPDFADLTQIRQNANRAAALVKQLLAFSRKQTLQPQSVRIAETVKELSHLLNRLLGARVEMKLTAQEGLWPVWIDKQQFEQVIVNLAVNARDAMPDGGKVTLACENRRLAKEVARDRATVPAGDYVEIKVVDTGVGIRRDRLDKIFEPFFTTKKVGEGTGLGLSTAYGIVKQMGGFIFVDSEEGRGTSFTLWLPRLMDEAVMAQEAPEPQGAADLTGSGRILLVEDEAPVRAFASRALKMRGYDVLEADCAEAAMEILEHRGDTVDLVISDVVMPGADGPAWVRKARETRPGIAVIFISGYAEDVFRKGMEGMENDRFLPKPFSLEELATAVKETLAARSTASDG